MSVSILEALECASINIENGKRMPMILNLAKEQLDNAIALLGKGYSIDDLVEDLIEEHGSIEAVPDKA